VIVLIVRVNVISRDFRFYTFQQSIDVCNIFVCLNKDYFSIICAHGNDNLFLERVFTSYAEFQFIFWTQVVYNMINFL